MKAQKTFRIIILEDSEFFNAILTQQIEYFTSTLAMEKNCRFEIQSYTSAGKCLQNLKNNTDIAFVDYYLGNGITGSDMVKKIRERCLSCKVVILSQIKDIKTSSISITDKAIDFIFKDANALPKSCFILKDMVNSCLSPHAMN